MAITYTESRCGGLCDAFRTAPAPEWVCQADAVDPHQALDKRIYQAKHMTFQEAVVEASRRGGQRRDETLSDKCLTCCDKGCKTITGAKKCEDLIGADTGEAAGTHADETCDAEGLDCKADDENGCFCIWLYKDQDKCPKDANDVADCKVSNSRLSCARFACTNTGVPARTSGETWLVSAAV